MTAKDLIRGIDALDERFILEAEAYQAPKVRHWGRWAVAAACVAIVAAVSWQVLPRLTAETAPPTGNPAESIEESDVPSASSDDGAVNVAEDSEETKRPDGESLGGVRLGMTQEEVEAVLGSDYEATEPRQQAETYQDLCWYYPEISVRFVDEGEGWTVQELMIREGSSLTLSTGIGVNSTREEILAAYPDADVAEDASLWSAHVQYEDSGLWIFLDPENGNYIRMASLSQNSADILTTESIGGLKLGMSQAEVEAVLGTDHETDSVTELRKYIKTVDWWYSGVRLIFADTGDGWFLNQIRLSEANGMTLSTGIGMDATAAEVREAYPNARTVVEDSDPYSDGIAERYLLVGSQNCGLRFYLDGDALYEIQLGDLVPAPEPISNLLASGEIVVHGADGTEVTLVDKAAKRVSTTLTISDPETAENPGETPQWWVDLGNGFYLAVYGHDDLATVYTGDSLDTTLQTMTEELTGVFLDLDSTLASAMENPTETWE